MSIVLIFSQVVSLRMNLNYQKCLLFQSKFINVFSMCHTLTPIGFHDLMKALDGCNLYPNFDFCVSSILEQQIFNVFLHLSENWILQRRFEAFRDWHLAI